MNGATEFPLCWPSTIARSKSRHKSQFRTSLAQALKNVKDSLRLFASDSGKPVSGIVISSNVTLGNAKPADPGVSIWFVWDGLSVCIPVDRYESVEANLQAIHYILEARRTEIRHGTLALVRATFTGFLALPSPQPRSCWDVLGLDGDDRTLRVVDVEQAFKKLAKTSHPDAGGNADKMAELNAARADAVSQLMVGGAAL